MQFCLLNPTMYYIRPPDSNVKIDSMMAKIINMNPKQPPSMYSSSRLGDKVNECLVIEC